MSIDQNMNIKSSTLLKSVYKDCIERGYIVHGDKLLPPNHPDLINISTIQLKKKRSIVNKTGWIDDDRNIKNKNAAVDQFMRLVKIELDLDVWPEFFFSTERLYRFDYAIPIAADGKNLKIAIEQEGGIYMRGSSGHSSGTGIKRDMDKNNFAVSNGWVIIRRVPNELIGFETLDLIKSIIK